MATATLAKTELMSLEEFLDQYVDDSGVELHRGRLVRIPMPGLAHGEICASFAAIIRDYVKRNKLGRTYSNDSFIIIEHEPGSCYGADVVYLSYETLPADQPSPKGAITPPVDLVVEVRSPSDTMKQMKSKATDYIEVGVKVVLIVEPNRQTVDIYRLNQPVIHLQSGDQLTLPDVLPGFTMPVSEFFE